MNLDLARWQFGITTVYHFLFVPLTIGLSLLVAGLQTAWVRTGDDHYLRVTKFWGKLFLINFAMGVVTGIVQEFQFGMNWSDYSRFVGDIFGAPLAIEGLLAFFLESTFLGLWIFGWDRLPKRLHLACIWLAVDRHGPVRLLHPRRQLLDAAPGRLRFNAARGRAELTDFGAVLTNATAVGAFPHTITAASSPAGMFVLAISAWHLARGQRHRGLPPVAAAGAGHRADRRHRRRHHRRPAGQADDRAAADEDGRRRGALRHRRTRVVLVFTIGSLDGSAGDLEHPAARRAVLPGHRLLRRQGRGHQRPPAAGDARPTGPATTCRTSRSPTGPSG